LWNPHPHLPKWIPTYFYQSMDLSHCLRLNPFIMHPCLSRNPRLCKLRNLHPRILMNSSSSLSTIESFCCGSSLPLNPLLCLFLRTIVLCSLMLNTGPTLVKKKIKLILAHQCILILNPRPSLSASRRPFLTDESS
jgi:hypothetical protein